jgi:PAS domain S-box-containing protein
MSRILVAEVNDTQARVLAAFLEAEGFEVETASDGRKALDLFVRSEFDLVIADVRLPGLDGYELCRKIKADPARRQVPVILLTSLIEPADVVRGITCGADNFLPRPCKGEVLVARVRSLFATRAMRAQGKGKAGLEAVFQGQTVSVPPDKEQLFDLLLSACEELVRTNEDLRASRAELRSAKLLVAQHNDQARLSEEKYHSLMERANDAIFVLTRSGKVLEANRRAAELLGRPREELLGRVYEEFTPADERARAREEFRKLLETGSARLDNVQFVRGDGRLVSVDCSYSVVQVGSGHVVMVIARDVTERDRLQQQLAQAQKMEAVGRLAGGVAHDFNNLLTVISGYSELVQDRLGSDAATRALVAEIGKAGERAAALTRQLLTFSRQQVIAPQILDVNAVVADTGKMLRRLIGEDIELTTSLDPALGRVKADPGQIGQVILNLAVNARDAMPKGGKLTIETQNSELDESYSRLHPDARPGRYVLLGVSDTGSGMDTATMARIFEPFFTTKGPGKGTGLGLATVYGIVKQGGGHVAAYSEVGRGTTFKVYLPRIEGRSLTSGSHPGLIKHVAGTETILLVEDEEAVRTLAALALRLSGYTILEADGVEDALRILEKHTGPLQLLVTDVVMPGVGGRVLADRLTERRPHLKVLYLSGYTDDAIVRHGVLEAEAHFLQKPFTGTALARKVREVLDGPFPE